MCTLIVVSVVNYLIYTARWDFALLHPAYVASQPPTISRAISDPIVGDPFAVWMLICAPILWIGVLLMIMTMWRGLRQNHGSGDGLKMVKNLSILVIFLQALASSGMIILSQYRFPDHDEMHMFGSYLFFFSQAFVVFSGELLSRAYDRLPPNSRLMLPAFCKLRRIAILGPIILSAVYLGLFIGKDFVSGPIRYVVLQAYVSIELLLISSFLFYILGWTPDCVLAVRRYLRA
ncbi:hypothetical protein [Shimia sp.]|uniref:hypothetical protein n=1 Tax=Shimia sp. TaxID=1954381 RepID=UPI0032999139